MKKSRPALKRVDPPPGGRLVVVGDVHGCYAELTELLARIRPGSEDLVISVGDMVRKGPDAARCLDLWRERGYLAVQGNNERRLLGMATPLLRFFRREDRDILWRDDLLRYIAGWPVVIDVEAHEAAVVHGGFLPDMQIDAQSIETNEELVTTLRWIRKKDGTWKPAGSEKKKKDDVLWSDRWKGERFVLYGHTPLRKPKLDRRALGLDTGCVYGGSLTAAIRAEDGQWATESVPAGARYAR